MDLADTTIFTDAKGREWDCRLTLASARRVDDSDFSALTDKEFSVLRPDRELFGELLTNTPLAFAVVWAIVYPQANRIADFPTDYDAAEMEFLEGLDGSAMTRGRQALWRSLADFFPDLKTALSTLIRQTEAGRNRINERMAGMEDRIEAMMNQEIDKGFKELEALLPN